MPLLIKLINAADNLSIWVHPDDCSATNQEKQPGTEEMWYVVNCDLEFTFFRFNRKLFRVGFI